MTHHEGPHVTDELSVERLLARYAHPGVDEPRRPAAPDPALSGRGSDSSGPDQRPWVRTNFVSTLDGAAQGSDGRTGTINNAADHLVFDTLRELADVVVVGGNTVRTEQYRAVRLDPARADRRRAQGRPPQPALLIVSAALDVPDALPLPDGGPVVVMTTVPHDHPRARALTSQGVEVVSVPAPELLTTLMTWCAHRGWSRVLCEGGPRLHSALIAADLVDEICLTITGSVIGGDHLRITHGADLASSFRIGDCFHTSDTVFIRMLRQEGH